MVNTSFKTLTLIRFWINTCHLSLPTHRISSSPKFLKVLLLLFTWHLANAIPILAFQFTTLFLFMPHLILGQTLVSAAFSMPFKVLKGMDTQKCIHSVSQCVYIHSWTLTSALNTLPTQGLQDAWTTLLSSRISRTCDGDLMTTRFAKYQICARCYTKDFA